MIAAAHEADARTALPRLLPFLSRYTGLVRDVAELLRSADDARLVRIGARTGDLRALVGRDAAFHPGGTGTTRAGALAAALGEAVERFSLLCAPVEQLVLATAEELDGRAVEPASFGLFSPAQYASPGFPFGPFTRRSRVRWVEATALPDGGRVLVPAQLVYLGHEHEDEDPIGYATTSGTACAVTWEGAVLGALLELVERDAFLVAWYSRLSLPRLDWSRNPRMVDHERRYFAPSGLRYRAVDLSPVLGVPTVLGLVRARGGASLGVGAAAAPAVEDAWARALAEAFAVRSWVKGMLEDGRRVPERADFADVTTFEDHVLLYADAERAAATAFLDAGRERTPADAVRPLGGEPLAALLRLLGDRGVRVYAVDVTIPPAAARGLRVARVLAPALCQLDTAHRGRFLGVERLYRGAFEAGLAHAPLHPSDLNPLPHPFP